jgi:ribosomal protein S18 acetylase RimI-like enzyme
MSVARVREARAQDRDAIREVTLAAYAEYAAVLPQAWEDYRANIVTTLARPRPARQLVAEQAGALVGAVMLYPPSASPGRAGAKAPPEVRLLAVAPSARGQGIGEALMRACIERARADGHAALTLHTTAVMRAALRLYGRLGFERAPELDVEVAPGLIVTGHRLDFARAGQSPYHTASGA